jgi:hypothetical protein
MGVGGKLNTVGSSMVVVDALDEATAGFYAAHGLPFLWVCQLGAPCL